MQTASRPRVRIRDAALHGAVQRQHQFCRMLDRRVGELTQATDRVDATVARIEAGLAADLVEKATYEVSLRLLPHGVRYALDRELTGRLAAFHDAAKRFEARYGEVFMA